MDESEKTYTHGTSSGYNYRKCRCEQCVAWKREARAKNRDSGKAAARERAYRAANPEKLREIEARKKAKREADPARQAAYVEYQRQYAAANAERKRELAQAWREVDPHRNWVSFFCGRSLERGAPIDANTRKWMEGLREQNPPCAYCGGQWETLDHAIPISKGGDSSRKNLLPCCHTCNRRKGAMDPYAWAARLATSRALPSAHVIDT